MMLCHELSYRLNDDAPLKFRDTATKQGLYKSLFTLLDKSSLNCRKILSLEVKCPHAHLAHAYAYYRLENLHQSIKILSKYSKCYREKDISWLATKIEKDFYTAMVYSLFLHRKTELKEYFVELFSHYYKGRFFLYHNLAVRLYFEELSKCALTDALIFVDEAIEENANEWSYALKAKILSDQKKFDLAEGAFSVAESLEPKIPHYKKLNQSNLFLFPSLDDTEFEDYTHISSTW